MKKMLTRSISIWLLLNANWWLFSKFFLLPVDWVCPHFSTEFAQVNSPGESSSIDVAGFPFWLDLRLASFSALGGLNSNDRLHFFLVRLQFGWNCWPSRLICTAISSVQQRTAGVWLEGCIWTIGKKRKSVLASLLLGLISRDVLKSTEKSTQNDRSNETWDASHHRGSGRLRTTKWWGAEFY